VCEREREREREREGVRGREGGSLQSQLLTSSVEVLKANRVVGERGVHGEVVVVVVVKLSLLRGGGRGMGRRGERRVLHSGQVLQLQLMAEEGRGEQRRAEETR